MSETTPAPRHAATLTRLDAWWAHTLRTPGRLRLWYWGGPIAVTLLAAVLRLWNLGQPHSLVFDETYYVKDAWTTLHLGHEAIWPNDSDTEFNAGDVNGFSDDGSFVAHPPLGKWIIALGLAVFGAQDATGWRISVAVVGILAVFLLTLVARALLRSTLLATIAGFLMAIDGNAIVMSRVALLDNMVMFLALLGFGAVLLDRGWHRNRLTAWLVARSEAGKDPGWGPMLWWRPWLLAAGILFGATSAVKWSGLYFLAVFAVYVVVVDALARRRAGIGFWASGAVLKQAPATFLLMVPAALLTYLVAWTGWIVTAGGYYRQWADEPGNAWTGALTWVPRWFQSLWHYQASMYNYHVGVSDPHAYQANPLTWLLMIRPTSMFYRGNPKGVNGCAFADCSETITELANPLIWWAATAALIYLVYRLVRRREWQVGLILAGVVAGYAPWMLYLHRTVFQFYTIAFEPYLILGLVFVIGVILGRPDDPVERRLSGIRVVGIYLGMALLVSAFFFPLWTGIQTPLWFWQLHIWLPTWH